MLPTTLNGDPLTPEQRRLHANRLRLIRAVLFGGTVEDYPEGDDRAAVMPDFRGRGMAGRAPALATAAAEPLRRSR